LGTGFFVHHRTVSAVKRVYLGCYTCIYIVRGCWCNIVVLNVHGTGEEKSDGSKHTFYEELGKVF
jgi:hypothetical protein